MEVSRRRFLKLLAAAGACGALGGVGCASSGGPAEMRQSSFFAFDTMCVVGGVAQQAQLDAALARCRWFEEKLSATIGGSDVDRINGAAGAPVEVEPETAELIACSLRYSQESDGLFDITIGVVSSLWDFKEGVVPSDGDIQRALPHVGYRNVQVEGRTVRLLDPQARIDLGGIAKGYIADDIVAQLGDAGVESAFVNLGGNVKVLGVKGDGSPWSIGVRSPEQGSDDVIASVESTGGSLVTSGLYERRFERGGRAYWHILDPRTGYPAESDVVSASVYAGASIDGDGYTKPLFMLGKEGALAFLARHPGLQALLIGADGSTTTTPGSSFNIR